MERLDGMDLAHLLRARGPMPLESTLGIAYAVGSALMATHSRGVVHRDLKPSNIFISCTDVPAGGPMATKELDMPRIPAAILLSLGLLLSLTAPGRADGLPDPPEGSAPGAVPLGIEAYPPSIFQFVTTIPDDGQGEGGGWQVATTRLNFVDARQLLKPKTWSCIVVVGVPLRTAEDGRISARYAAQVTADIATEASPRVMLRKPQWMQADFCSEYGMEMSRLFVKHYKSLGARAKGK